jgi:endonuclease/exonuclease/phosphatase family metal-dependent hydrolase
MEPAAASRDSSAEASRFRIMSFNAWRDHPSHAPWSRRRELFLSILKFHRPDVIGAQEFLLPMIRLIENDLPEFAWIGAGRDDGREAGEFTPIFYRRDRFELLAQNTFWLAPDPAAPSRGWGAACARTVTWARLRRREDGAEYCHFNTHFDHFSARARRESACLLRREIDALAGGAPVVITGDLNCRENSVPYALLTGADAFLDARACGEYPPLGPRKTWRGFLPGGIGGGRLDYIFVNRKVRVLQHATLADHWDGRYASDHLPVAADIALSAGANAD